MEVEKNPYDETVTMLEGGRFERSERFSISDTSATCNMFSSSQSLTETILRWKMSFGAL